MAAIDPAGSQLVWEDGLPFEGVLNGSADTGTTLYWFEGLPADYFIPASDAGQAAGHGGFAMLGIGS